MKQKLPSMSFLRGRKAQRIGKNFEQMISEQCKQQEIKAIKHHVPTVLSRGKLIYLSKGAPDFNIIYQGISVYFDAKTFDSDRITYSQIKRHQVLDLAELKASGCNSGYLCWLREIGIVGWVPVGDLLNLAPGASIKHDQMIILGSASPGLMEPQIHFSRLFSLDWESKRCVNCKKVI